MSQETNFPEKLSEMEGKRLLELCRVMLRRLVRCILDFDCFSVLAQ